MTELNNNYVNQIQTSLESNPAQKSIQGKRIVSSSVQIFPNGTDKTNQPAVEKIPDVYESMGVKLGDKQAKISGISSSEKGKSFESAPAQKDENPPKDTGSVQSKSINIPSKSKDFRESYLDKECKTKNIFNAGKSILNTDGTTYSYDDNGYISAVFDDKGNMSRKVYRNFDGNVDFFKDYEYDDKGNITREVSQDLAGDYYKYKDYEYDNKGNKTRVIQRNLDGSVDFFNDYEYNDKRELTRHAGYDNAGHLIALYNYEYNDKGVSRKVVYENKDVYIPDYGHEVMTEHYAYEYDDKGKIARKVNYTPEGVVVDYSNYEYNDKGYKTREVHRDSHGDLVKASDFKYDDNNNLVQEVNYASNGSLVNGYDLKYDDNGNLTQKYYYQYDDKGNKHITKEYYGEYNDFGIATKGYYYEYDDNGKLTQEVRYENDELIQEIHYKYDENGNRIKDVK